MTPQEALRQVCQDCLGLTQFSFSRVGDCQGDTAANGACPIYSKRLKGRVSVRLIRKYCLYCQGNSSRSVEECTTSSCGFHMYRFGKNPAMAHRRFKYKQNVP